ncbi:MAG: YggT family protein [Alphaproteobacteria bacterium]|jgi:YggT family protein|nr:YggT family protein [Rhodospirillaceae bacterium]MDG2480987.1 YggT family protein [Alphaproteobacteria bacterium]MBT6204955.1 YggT family protein [Rhodospirillaceae bacterium]MBT6510857.1 YggT family protein [Rhodospirillaceae bacterium]MBT7612812.1 YggT family protein [Rhodospirillaceae bacterium]
MEAVIWLVDTIFRIYFWILIGQVVMSWLVSFKIVDTRQPIVHQVGRFLWQVTEPVLGPIRKLLSKFLGNLGGIDISPIIAILALEFLRRFIVDTVLAPLAYGS